MGEPLKVLDLFSGIGGFSLGLERAGMETVAFCEIEPYAQRVLNKHWPEVPIYEDVREVTAEQLRSDGIGDIDIITGGFPCQDLSGAGKQEGIGGVRSGLWGELWRIISELRPRYAIVENVSNLLAGERGSWFGRVLGDLAEIGYDAEWHCVPASAIGAPHQRDRVWIIAYPCSLVGTRNRQILTWNSVEEARVRCSEVWMQDRFEPQVAAGDAWGMVAWRDVGEPCLLRVDDGLPEIMGELKGYGNAVVPQIPEMIGRAIMDIENTRKSHKAA